MSQRNIAYNIGKALNIINYKLNHIEVIILVPVAEKAFGKLEIN